MLYGPHVHGSRDGRAELAGGNDPVPQDSFVSRPTNGLAIASFVVSLCGLCPLLCVGLVGAASLIGAILGHVALARIRARNERGRGWARWGITLGWVGVVVGGVVVGTLTVGGVHIHVPADVGCRLMPCP